MNKIDWLNWSKKHIDWKEDGNKVIRGSETINVSSKLSFGTGGIRGLMGLGTDKLNDITVYQFASAYGKYLLHKFPNMESKILLSYDGRQHSRSFAEIISGRLLELGINAYLLDSPHSTPELTYGVRTHPFKGGIMVTASHNPKEYNGIKVYDERGIQLLPDEAMRIASYMQREDLVEKDFFKRVKAVSNVSSMIESDYQDMLHLFFKDCSPVTNITSVYTALEGVGARAFIKAVHRLKFLNVHYVHDQIIPSGTFEKTDVINPEDERAFDKAIVVGKKHDADILLATDPDADRIGVMVKLSNGDYKKLSGNEVGALFVRFLVDTGKLKSYHRIATTVVSGEFAQRVAADHGIESIKTLTGFKYLSDLMAKDSNIQFAFEESCGYNFFNASGDKDGIMAALMVIRMASYYKKKGRSLYAQLKSLQFEVGHYTDYLVSIPLANGDFEVMRNLLTDSLSKSNLVTTNIEDLKHFKNGVQTYKSKGVVFHLEEGFVALRPSGTEPKVKCYISIKGNNAHESVQMLYFIIGLVQEIAS